MPSLPNGWLGCATLRALIDKPLNLAGKLAPALSNIGADIPIVVRNVGPAVSSQQLFVRSKVGIASVYCCM